MDTKATLHLDHFLRAVHRRRRVIRGLERMGLCLLGSWVLIMLLIPLLLWRGQPALPLVGLVAAIGGIGGMIWSFTRPAALLQTAMEADRQLGLSDLLATALTIRDAQTADPWRQTVVAMAEARCRGLSPSSVISHRLGVRAWGGIGLAGGLVLTLGLIFANPPATRAGSIPLAIHNPSLIRQPTHPAKTAFPGLSRDALDNRPTDAAELSEETSLSSISANGELQPNEKKLERSALNLSNRDNSSNGDGKGDGMSQTFGSEIVENTPNERDTNSSNQADSNALPVIGAGLQLDFASEVLDENIHSGSVARMGLPLNLTPIWKNSARFKDQQAALRAIDAGDVPDEYRDLVRGYFEQ